jgi:hypothetical protein
VDEDSIPPDVTLSGGILAKSELEGRSMVGSERVIYAID